MALAAQGSLGGGNVERPKGNRCILEEQLLEIAHAVEQETVGIGRLDLEILSDDGGRIEARVSPPAPAAAVSTRLASASGSASATV